MTLEPMGVQSLMGAMMSLETKAMHLISCVNRWGKNDMPVDERRGREMEG